LARPDAALLKTCQMIASPFAYLRGDNDMFYRKFAQDPRLDSFASLTWIQGDVHIDNFGSFLNAKNQLVYDLNDFDESLVPGDFQLDVLRMATSILLVSLDNEVPGNRLVQAFLDAYLVTLMEKHPQAETRQFSLKKSPKILADFLEKVLKKKCLKKLLKEYLGEGQKFNFSHPELGIVSQDIQDEIEASFPSYVESLGLTSEKLIIKSIAERFGAGLGSIGLERFYLLIERTSQSQKQDMILDVKMQIAPAGSKYLKIQSFSNEAQRHEMSMKAMVRFADPFLGSLEIKGEYFSVRQLDPYKAKFRHSKLTDEESFMEMARVWGTIVAWDHARSNPKFPDQVVNSIRGREGEFKRLMGRLAIEFAQDTFDTWSIFKAANSQKCQGVPVQ
jgi:uncharacterized protein (DUF2252 family)